jgi:predicted ArsR family transcriptional regulator
MAVKTEADRLKASLARALRKRDHKSLSELAKELETNFQRLARPMEELVTERKAIRHDGKPPKYSKA